MAFGARSIKGRLIEAAGLAGHPQEFPTKVDGAGLRLLTVFLPIKQYCPPLYGAGVE